MQPYHLCLLMKVWEDDQRHVPWRNCEERAPRFHFQRPAVQRQTVRETEDSGHLRDKVPVTDWKVSSTNKHLSHLVLFTHPVCQGYCAAVIESMSNSVDHTSKQSCNNNTGQIAADWLSAALLLGTVISITCWFLSSRLHWNKIAMVVIRVCSYSKLATPALLPHENRVHRGRFFNNLTIDAKKQYKPKHKHEHNTHTSFSCITVSINR